jgi:hypothetical protein
MQAYQLRVVDEKVDLDERLRRLEGFIEGPDFALVDDQERERLTRQRDLMVQLSAVLGERIEEFG